MAILGPVVANIAFVMELTLVPLLLPAIQEHFRLSISDLAWVFNSYGISVALGVLLGGWAGDAFNTRKVFACGAVLFVAGALLVTITESFETLIIGRILQGLGGGIFSPLVPILLTRASPLRPGRALIVWGSIAGYVAAFAPIFYGSFLTPYGWKTAFLLIAAISAVALVVLSKTQEIDGDNLSQQFSMDYSALFRAHKLWLTLVYVFCTYGSITYYLFRLPVWLANHEFQALSVGFILSITWLTFSGLSSLMRNLVDKPHIRKIMTAAPFLIAGGLPLSNDPDNLLFLVVSAVLIGAGFACSNAPSTQLILRFAPQRMSAVSTSLDITFARLGGIATVALLAGSEFKNAALAIFLMCLVSAFCALRISSDLRNDP